jgi:hypothetical protein
MKKRTVDLFLGQIYVLGSPYKKYIVDNPSGFVNNLDIAIRLDKLTFLYINITNH